jgi:hypothetical protein
MCPKSQILCSTLQTNSIKFNVITVLLVKNCLGSYVNLSAYTHIQVNSTVDFNVLLTMYHRDVIS